MRRLLWRILGLTWTRQHLDAVLRRIVAPLDLVPAGLLTPDVMGLILESAEFKRLKRLRGYLEWRMQR